MKKRSLILLAIVISIFNIACSENYSNGERIGLVTQFSKRGMLWKSWEGHLNITQTGMNSADGFDFSIDNDKENEKTISLLDSAASIGWKVKLIYHESFGFNWLSNRGETNHFIDSVIVVDKSFSSHNNATNLNKADAGNGRVIDTVYIVITPSDINYKKFFK
jgi:hypothetical protein